MAKDRDLKRIKAEYEKARKKYALPKFEDMDKEFEIRLIEERGFVVKEVRRAILTHIQNLSSFFLPVLDPHLDELHALIEMPAFSKKEKEELFNFYKKVIYLLHKGVTSSVISEKAEADFIKEIWKQWPQIKREASIYMQKITGEWTNQRTIEKEDTHYLG